MGSFGRKLCTAVVAVSAVTWPSTYLPSTFMQFPASVAHADSTGKFSTKMTARKRYLPRIVAGYQQLAPLLQNPTSFALSSFETDELPSLKRAMNLYGASLRKGEVPDETSRAADKLTEDFVAAFEKAKANKYSKESVQGVKVALDKYVEFAKIQIP
eukprot:gene27624-33362_t